MTRYQVYRIRPGIVGYDTLAAAAYPWLVTPVGVERGSAFPSHRQALHYATTGEVLSPGMSREERAAWRERNAEFFAEWRAKSKAHRAVRALRNADPDHRELWVLP